MAEALVFVVLQKIAVIIGGEVIKAGTSKLFKEVPELRDVQYSIKQIQREFGVMQGLLRKVDVQAFSDQSFDSWLEQVKEVAHDVEDIIEEYTYLIGQKRSIDTIAKKTIYCVKKTKTWHEMATHLQEVRGHLDHLTQMRACYGITIPGGSKSNKSNATGLPNMSDYSHFVDENEIVGHSNERNQLIGLLTNTNCNWAIISIWGMGGLGKTTLVSSIYNRKEIKAMFECCAFILVSQNFHIEDLLRSTIKQILERERKSMAEFDSMDRRLLEETIRTKLQNKRYMIVLDDVWRRDAWLSLSNVFPKNNKGSRVVITTRIEDVACLADANWLIPMRPLSNEEARVLFYRKAFGKLKDRTSPQELVGWFKKLMNKCQGLHLAVTHMLFNKKFFGKLEEETCPQELVGWAEKIVDRCQGLPQAIVAIGSLLSFRGMEEAQWRLFYNQLSWELSSNPDLSSVANVLNLSYDNLPTHLKNCFLYCSLLPEDFLIRRKWIIRIMVAEGFIKGRGPDTTLEEVAESYLMELVQRSLLQVVERNIYGRAKRFRMNDLVRDICITKAKNENFGIYCDDRLSLFHGKARRTFIHNIGDVLQPIVESSKLRSLLLFQTKLSSSVIQGALANLRLLRVLCLGRSNIESLPNVVFELFNLHYLDISRTKVKVIPKSLGNLKLLQTLDIWLTSVEKLPREITNLSKLRHLFARSDQYMQARQYDCFNGVPISPNICNTKDLQTLQWIEANDELVAKLASLLMLRTLCLLKVKASHIGALWVSVTELPFLSFLGIVASNEDEVLDLRTLNPLPGLQKLHLKGKLMGGVIPQIFGSFTKMRDLALGWSRLQEDPLQSFSHMSNLVRLHLYRIFEGGTLTFCSGWFPKLQILYLADLFELVDINFEDGTMESLHILKLLGLSNLTHVPEGMKYLRTLNKLILTDMSNRFINELGQNQWKILHHIKFITR